MYCGGQMDGLLSAMATHATTLGVLASEWETMYDNDFLTGPIQSDRHSIQDVAAFYMTILRGRVLTKKTISASLRGAVDAARLDLILWIADAVNIYVRRVYNDTNPAVHRAPPALQHNVVRGDQSTPSRRRYVVVWPGAAWDLMEKASAARVNNRQAIAVRSDQDDLGCADTRTECWAQKKTQMVQARISAVFTHCLHWNLVADPGTHSYRDLMPFVLYSWEEDVACLPKFQHLKPAKAQVFRLQMHTAPPAL